MPRNRVMLGPMPENYNDGSNILYGALATYNHIVDGLNSVDNQDELNEWLLDLDEFIREIESRNVIPPYEYHGVEFNKNKVLEKLREIKTVVKQKMNAIAPREGGKQRTKRNKKSKRSKRSKMNGGKRRRITKKRKSH